MKKPYYPRQQSAQSIEAKEAKIDKVFSDYANGKLPESSDVQEVILQNIKACKYD